MQRTRFAPSPTGRLHLGNLYSALYCEHWARKQQAELLLRMENIDHTRCRPHWQAAILDDLRWLSWSWHGSVRYQSPQLPSYQQALTRLRALGMIYPCCCTRRNLHQQPTDQHKASTPHADPYPGTCRTHPPPASAQPFAWRLDIQRAIQHTRPLYWTDSTNIRHPVNPAEHGDAIIARRDIGTSYHLAVVVDDGAQGISHIIRGTDLRPHTGLHRILQALLDLPAPTYQHHPLLLDGTHKYSKSKRSPNLDQLRTAGWNADAVRQHWQRFMAEST